MELNGQRHAPAALLSGTIHRTYCVGGWVGRPRAGLDGSGEEIFLLLPGFEPAIGQRIV